MDGESVGLVFIPMAIENRYKNTSSDCVNRMRGSFMHAGL